MSERRLFFALWPDDRQRNLLRDTFRPLLSTVEGKAVDRRNWHVTLVFIGQFPENDVDELLAKQAQIECEPFRLRFDQLNFWARPRIACLQAMTVPEELLRLKKQLGAMLADYDIAPEEHEYRPHITAVRSARPFEPQRLARPVELQWSRFEIVESVSVPGGVQYRPLKQ